MNQCGAGIRPNGSPIATTYWADADGIPQYRLVFKDEKGNWQSATVSDFCTPFELNGYGTLPLPHSRPELVVSSNDEALIVFRSAEFRNRLMVTSLQGPQFEPAKARRWILVDDDLGFYEPIICHEAWEVDQELVMFVQKCSQAMGGDAGGQRRSEEAWIGLWRLN
jgi:hypothetical protein